MSVWHVLINGQAGHQRDDGVLQALAQAAGSTGHELQLHRPAPQQGLAQVAQAVAAQVAPHSAGPATGDLLVAVGGDGTVNTVAAAALARGCAFGLVPRGTFNVFAQSLGIPEDPTQAALALAHAPLRSVQVGRVNGLPFFVNASLGLYPTLLEDREAVKARLGRSRGVALLAALLTLLRGHRRLRLEAAVDGQQVPAQDASTLFIANRPDQLLPLGVGTAQQAGHGALAGVLLQAPGRLELLHAAWRALRGRLDDDAAVTSLAFSRLTVAPAGRRARAGVKVATDGEVQRLRFPLTFEVGRERLWVRAPLSAAAPIATQAAKEAADWVEGRSLADA